jgi:hypothetical protein
MAPTAHLPHAKDDQRRHAAALWSSRPGLGRYLDAAALMNWYEISEERFERRARPVINIAAM